MGIHICHRIVKKIKGVIKHQLWQQSYHAALLISTGGEINSLPRFEKKKKKKHSFASVWLDKFRSMPNLEQ